MGSCNALIPSLCERMQFLLSCPDRFKVRNGLAFILGCFNYR